MKFSRRSTWSALSLATLLAAGCGAPTGTGLASTADLPSPAAQETISAEPPGASGPFSIQAVQGQKYDIEESRPRFGTLYYSVVTPSDLPAPDRFQFVMSNIASASAEYPTWRRSFNVKTPKPMQILTGSISAPLGQLHVTVEAQAIARKVAITTRDGKRWHELTINLYRGQSHPYFKSARQKVTIPLELAWTRKALELIKN